MSDWTQDVTVTLTKEQWLDVRIALNLRAGSLLDEAKKAGVDDYKVQLSMCNQNLDICNSIRSQVEPEMELA
jgi:hypothetical protein